jgi:predicted transcriptional regulator
MAQSLKREAINALESMPDDAVMDDIMYRLYVLDKVKKGLKELDMGNYYTSEEVKKEIESW